MPFTYRLQKVLNYRIQKKEEQLEVVRKAQQEIVRIQTEINKKHEEIKVLRKNMYSYHHTMIESYDVYIEHLTKLIEKLEVEKQQAIERLNIEKEKLAEIEKGIKALEKHKEKAYEAYLEEEKEAEMRMLNEIAGLKHFAMMQEKKQEELDELLALEALQQQESGLNFDEY